VIDAETEAVWTVECGASGNFKWYGITAVDAKLFCAPFSASSVLTFAFPEVMPATLQLEVGGCE
jgi:hypothetical protein